MSPRVRAKARTVATLLSSNAVNISSFAMAGPPVTPARTFGNSRCRRAMVLTDRHDRVASLGEVALLDEHEQPVMVGGEEVPRVRIVEPADRERGGPGRRVSGLAVETGPDLVDHGLEETEIRRSLASQPEIEEAEGHRVGDLLIEPLEEPGQ